MAKIYLKKTVVEKPMKSRKEIISFLLNYSKALSFIKTSTIDIEFISN